MPLPRGFHQPFPPRAENIAAVEIELVAQLVDRLLLFLDSLVVELTGLIECGPEIFGRGLEVFGRGLEVLDLLSEPAQQVVTFAGIGGP